MSIENITIACVCVCVSKHQLHLLSKYKNRCASTCISIESTMQCNINIKWYFLDLKRSFLSLSLSLSVAPSLSLLQFFLSLSHSFSTCIVYSFVRGFNSKSLNRFHTCGIRYGDEQSKALILLLHFNTTSRVLGGSRSGNQSGKTKKTRKENIYLHINNNNSFI